MPKKITKLLLFISTLGFVFIGCGLEQSCRAQSPSQCICLGSQNWSSEQDCHEHDPTTDEDSCKQLCIARYANSATPPAYWGPDAMGKCQQVNPSHNCVCHGNVNYNPSNELGCHNHGPTSDKNSCEQWCKERYVNYADPPVYWGPKAMENCQQVNSRDKCACFGSDNQDGPKYCHDHGLISNENSCKQWCKNNVFPLGVPSSAYWGPNAMENCQTANPT